MHAESHAALCRELSARLLSRMAAIGEPPATIVPTDKRPSGQRRAGENDVLAW